MAERVGFEPTERGRRINNLLKPLEFQPPRIPPRAHIWHLIWHQPKRSCLGPTLGCSQPGSYGATPASALVNPSCATADCRPHASDCDTKLRVSNITDREPPKDGVLITAKNRPAGST
jgi:hypothetical protein